MLGIDLPLHHGLYSHLQLSVMISSLHCVELLSNEGTTH